MSQKTALRENGFKCHLLSKNDSAEYLREDTVRRKYRKPNLDPQLAGLTSVLKSNDAVTPENRLHLYDDDRMPAGA